MREYTQILFIHQSFPSQYKHILRALAGQAGHQLVGMGINPPAEPLPTGVTYVQYGLKRGNTPKLHEWLLDIDSKFVRGEACARAAVQLRDQGFLPDLICAHPGWGEALFLKDVWPQTRLLCYQEFFYHSQGFDLDFDLELQNQPDWELSARTRLKNINPLIMLQASDWNVTPTAFQHSTFPDIWRPQITIAHDGVDTNLASPSPVAKPIRLPDGTVITAGEATITFINRSLEPYRGCHTFLRAIPEIQRRLPLAQIVVVGNTKEVSYGWAAPSGSWCDIFLAEIDGHYDPSRLHFTGLLTYSNYLQLLKLSACHVYLTYPFVLSWSLLEAMSSGCAIVGSATPPVEEVINHGQEGLLVDFFSPSQLADAVYQVLSDLSLAQTLGKHARTLALRRFSIERCVPQQLALMQLVLSGALSK